jgi:hypothetical protein
MDAIAGTEKRIVQIYGHIQRTQTLRTDAGMYQEVVQLLAIGLVRTVSVMIAIDGVGRVRSASVHPTNWPVTEVTLLTLGVALAVTHRLVRITFGVLSVSSIVMFLG